jgi:hypothetical protein
VGEFRGPGKEKVFKLEIKIEALRIFILNYAINSNIKIKKIS